VKSRLFLMLLLMLWFSISAFAKEEIIWLQNNRPPWLISSGEYKNKGYGDVIRTFLTKNYLQDYKHLLLPINPSRAMQKIKDENTNLCYGPAFKIKTLESLFYFSKPIYVLPQGRIIVTNETFNRLNRPDELSMEKLIQNPEFRLGTIKNSFYYPIDMTKYNEQNNVTTLSTSSPIVHLLAMMKKGRIDWVFDYNVFVKWEAFLNPNYENIFKTIKVTETQKLPLSVTYIACSKNSLGKGIIEKMNKGLTRSNILEMRKEVRKWQLDANTLQAFDKLNLEYFGF